MKFPENWLREWVNPPIDSQQLADSLTQAGIEVEAMQSAAAAFDGVVVAQIIAAAPHPNAEKLRVCEVSTGTETLQIVCGAPNARVGIKVPLAQVGAVLPGGLKIQRAALRGVDSAGMLCSAKELGLSSDSDGLLELDSAAIPGRSVREALALDEQVLELKLTPNRADCLSIRGLAFEVAAEHGLRVADEMPAPVAIASALSRNVRVEDEAACPRYLGRIIDGVDLSRPTPDWMRARLERSGLRAISLGVDISNYVMLELGQPLHAFDDEKLTGDVVIRFAREGESIQLLDATQATLTSKTLVIADANGAVAVAGVMGGESSKTLTSTTRIFLESAHFVPSVVMGRARALGVSSDAAYRFERGVDPELPERALERATALYLALAGGQAGSIVRVQATAHLSGRRPVQLRMARLQSLLGMAVARSRAEEILAALGMQVHTRGDVLEVTPPSRRFDIEIEEDLIEEIARIVGFDQIDQVPLSGPLRQPSLPENRRPRSAVREQLSALGFQEAITFSFVSSAQLAAAGLDANAALALKNPLSSDLERMRPSLIPGLLAALGFNLNRQAERVRLFELGASFSTNGSSEPLRLAGVIQGLGEPEQWGRHKRVLDFYDVKGLVAQLLPDFAALALSNEGAPWLHPGQSATLHQDGRWVGTFGALHPQVVKNFDLRGAVFAFELDAEVVLARRVPRAQAISRFPSIRRDLAFSVPREVAAAKLEAAARNAGGTLLKDLVVFDVFADDQRDIASKSVAIGLILQDDSATLNDTVISETVDAVVASVEKHCAAVLRS